MPTKYLPSFNPSAFSSALARPASSDKKAGSDYLAKMKEKGKAIQKDISNKFAKLEKATPPGVRGLGKDVGDNLGVMATAAVLKAADNTDVGRQVAGLTGGRLETSDLVFLASCVGRVTGLDGKLPGGRKASTAAIKAMTTLYAANVGARTPDAVKGFISSSKMSKPHKVSGTEEESVAPTAEATAEAATEAPVTTIAGAPEVVAFVQSQADEVTEDDADLEEEDEDDAVSEGIANAAAAAVENPVAVTVTPGTSPAVEPTKS